MKYKIYREFGSLNSPPIFDAVETGLKKLGHVSTDHDEDVSVIWSALWAGRMAGNQKIYQHQRSMNKNVLIVEVGNLKRNLTWRLSFNNINRDGIFANNADLNDMRPSKLNVCFKDSSPSKRPEILIAAQHGRSLQWANMPTMERWIENTIKSIRKISDRPIILRPHPRFPIRRIEGCLMESPKKIIGSYDDFDINYDYHCVINHNSGPGIQAVLRSTPVIVGTSSLAYEVSSRLTDIGNFTIPDRSSWLIRLCHTEWTVDEIKSGYPLERLFSIKT